MSPSEWTEVNYTASTVIAKETASLSTWKLWLQKMLSLYPRAAVRCDTPAHDMI